MTFWMIALALAALAAAFVLVPGYLFNRREVSVDRKATNLSIYEERVAEYDSQLENAEINESEHAEFIVELKRTLLSDVQEEDSANEATTGWLPMAFGILIPVFAFIAYSDFGLSWGAIGDVAIAEEMQSVNPHDSDAMETNLEKLAERLKTQPDNHEGWYMLGRSYLNMGRYEESAAAFSHLLKTFTEDHSLYAYYAEALYMAEERVVTPRVAEAIDKTLALNPHDITMLEIKALGAFQREDKRGAIALFQRALAAGAEGERADLINRAIVRIQEDLGDAPMMEEVPLDELETAASSETSAKAIGRTIKVLVEVADHVDMPASTSVFVYARARSGPPMPLAVQRMTKADLPTVVTLDESMAMMQGMGLANFDQVEVLARISSTGIANASPEDYQAVSAPIDLTTKTDLIKLTISQQVKDF